MSSYRLILLLISTFSLCNIAYGKIVIDTLRTNDNDKIIITYDITYHENEITINFLNQRKILGIINKKEYSRVDRIAVMFFDRTGNFDSDVRISNMVPEAFMIPYNVDYKASYEGFFVIQDSPSITFRTTNRALIKIPIYLAYHKKRGNYLLFSKSNDLKIELLPKINKDKKLSKQMVSTIVSTSELECDNGTEIKILESIKTAQEYLSKSNTLPFSENLIEEIKYLRMIKHDIIDPEMTSRISILLNQYEDKKNYLENEKQNQILALQQIEENKIKQKEDALKAHNDSITSKMNEEREKKESRNIWIIIGGIILTILMFIGNQILQHFRVVRSQQNMMNMQQSLASKAEAEAKRQTRNIINKETNRILNKTKDLKYNKTSGTYKSNKKSKKISI